MDLHSRLISLVLCSFSLLPATLKANDCALPATSEILAHYLQNAKSNVAETEKDLTAIPVCEKNYENTLKPWNQLGSDILLNFSILTYISEGNFPASNEAYDAIQNFEGFLFQSVILNPSLQNTLLNYADNALGESYPLNSYENYQISCLLHSYETIKSVLPLEEQARLESLQAQSSIHKKTPYLHLKGLAVEKCISEEQIDEGFTVFDLNTCFLPGELTFLHGGMAHWQDRVSALADKILCVDADVVCLQEVFTEEAGFALYHKLKENYSHFYIAIGPRPLGFSAASFGLPSGLFVASKYHVEHPHFTRFAATGFQMNYGVFDFVIKNDSHAMGHIYTTHMQSLNKEGFPEIRAQELKQIIEKIKSDYDYNSDLGLPRLLCGDLNIAWGSCEPGEALIRDYFFDAYNHGRTEVTEADRTCTDYFSEFCCSFHDYPPCFDANVQIIDYALLYQPLPGYSAKPICKRCSMKTELVPMNALDRPESAISDHHGLLITVKKAKNRKNNG